MSNIKFSQLPNLGNITANTIVPVVSANTNYTVTAANLQSYVNSSTGNVTFNDVNIIGTGNLHLQPDPANSGAYLDIYLTAVPGPDIHIAGNGENVIIGRDTGANILVAVDGKVSIQSNAGTPYTWTFGYDGNLVLPANTFAVNYANGTAVSLGGTYGNANVVANLAALGSNPVSTTGNITSGNTSVTGNIQAGNIRTAGLVSATANITGGNVLTGGLISAAGTVTGTSHLGSVVSVTANVTGGNILTGGIVSATGNITTAGNFVGNGAALTNVATRFEGSWTVPTGNSTQSFTVAASETYYLWVDCNIPNGILVWNATATVTNTNVPVVGAQYAWVYNGGGTPIDFTSIPNQFVGTANAIVRSSTSPSATTNRFDFGINNTSGSAQTVRYGWVTIS